MSQIQRRFLRALRDAQDRGIPVSGVPATCIPTLTALETCGALKRRSSGRGEVVLVSNIAPFDLYVKRRFPLGIEETGNLPEDRVSGVRMFGDAKTAPRGRCEGVFVRSHKPEASLVSADGVHLRAGELTASAGVAALTLDAERRWTFRGTVAVVENAEPFWQHERELPEVDLAIFASGRLSERALSWLASDDMATCRLVHWGDYDPVGCMEFIRLRDRCGPRVTMHLPNRVEDLLPRFGKAVLLSDQLDTLATLRSLDVPREVTCLLAMFDRFRRGMEQEALLI